MTCRKCNSDKVRVENVSEVTSKGGNVPMWYWCSMVCPMIDFILYFCIVGFFGITIYNALKRSADKTKTKVQTYAVCQNCGNHWKV